MAHRPIEAKKRRKAVRAFTRTPLQARINLIEWLMDRGHAGSRKQARELILAKRVRSDSHVLGIVNDQVPGPTAAMEVALGRPPTMVTQEVVAPLVDAKLRKTIVVL
jgi:hypothetical protein